ncbi:MAG: protein-L-isoaspartate(D-aspartate) O-methyltransferase [Candidatus Omnitrophota bacterium]
MNKKTVLVLLAAALVAFGIKAAFFNKASKAMSDEQAYEQKRKAMVLTQLQSRGITDPRVLDAMTKVKRHLFIPDSVKDYAYSDSALPIEESQTISQPYIVALMTQLARLKPADRVLEIGTGSGYQAAVLSELVKEVFSIELRNDLAVKARDRLKELGYENVTVRQGDGYKGWPEKAPFDAILVTAAPDHPPEELIKELKAGGRLVIPVGSLAQELFVITKNPDGSVVEESIIPVRFVPMVTDHDAP